ncbi:uncharacterized protein [Argopecten irradians]|uniref:uncharacterized protein n=1 Tax=Argopecten irradians TaxID=31199 RepID=UPI00371F61AA
MNSSPLSQLFMLFISSWLFQKARSSIIGCPDVTPSPVSYIDNSGLTWCYWLKSTGQSSNFQAIMCAQNGGTLASLPSAEHETVVKTALGSTWSVSENVYIGVRDITNTGNFQTWSGGVLTYANWATAEPQSFKYCVYMHPVSYEWYTTHCNDHIPAVCFCVIDPLDSNTCSGAVISGGVASADTTVPQTITSNANTTVPQTITTNTNTTVPQTITTNTITTVPSSNTVYTTSVSVMTTNSNACYPHRLSSCLSCCYAHQNATTTRSSVGTSFNDVVADLKIDVKQTNKFQRRLHSIADHRPLSVSIGTVALLTLIAVIAVIITCDFPVLCAQWKMLKRFVRHQLCKRPRSRVARNSRSIFPEESGEMTLPTVSTS